MNAVTGHGVISAILCVAMENRFSEWFMGVCAVVFGFMGVAMEVADRMEKRKVIKNGDDLPDPSR